MKQSTAYMFVLLAAVTVFMFATVSEPASADQDYDLTVEKGGCVWVELSADEVETVALGYFTVTISSESLTYVNEYAWMTNLINADYSQFGEDEEAPMSGAFITSDSTHGVTMSGKIFKLKLEASDDEEASGIVNVSFEVDFSDPSTHSIEIQNKTVRVLIVEPEHTITVNPNHGTEPTTTVKTDIYGHIATEPALSFTGHHIKKWTDDSAGSGTQIEFGENGTKFTADDEIFAQWTQNEFTVTLKPGDEATGDDQIENVTYGDAHPIPDMSTYFTYDGHHITGWQYGEETLAKDYDLSQLAVGHGDNVEMTAIWEANVFTVQFDPNGGVGESMPDAIVVFGTPQLFPACTYTCPGCHFGGWTVDLQTYQTTDDMSAIPADHGDTVSAVAKWIDNTYTFTFSAVAPSGETGDIAGEMVDQVVTHGTDTTLTTNAFELTGWEFAGWDSNNDGSVDYLNGAEVGHEDLDDGATVSLKAVWTGTSVQYTVKHWKMNEQDEQYTEWSTEPKQGTAGQQTAAVARSDYPEGYNVLPFEQRQIQGDGSTLIEIFYGRFVSIVFDTNGASTEDPVEFQVTAGVSVDVPSLTLQGGTLMGWREYNADANTLEADAETFSSEANIVLYAVWKTTDAGVDTYHYKEGVNITLTKSERTSGDETVTTTTRIYDSTPVYNICVVTITETEGSETKNVVVENRDYNTAIPEQPEFQRHLTRIYDADSEATVSTQGVITGQSTLKLYRDGTIQEGEEIGFVSTYLEFDDEGQPTSAFVDAVTYGEEQDQASQIYRKVFESDSPIIIEETGQLDGGTHTETHTLEFEDGVLKQIYQEPGDEGAIKQYIVDIYSEGTYMNIYGDVWDGTGPAESESISTTTYVVDENLTVVRTTLAGNVNTDESMTFDPTCKAAVDAVTGKVRVVTGTGNEAYPIEYAETIEVSDVRTEDKSVYYLNDEQTGEPKWLWSTRTTYDGGTETYDARQYSKDTVIDQDDGSLIPSTGEVAVPVYIYIAVTERTGEEVIAFSEDEYFSDNGAIDPETGELVDGAVPMYHRVISYTTDSEGKWVLSEATGRHANNQITLVDSTYFTEDTGLDPVDVDSSDPVKQDIVTTILDETTGEFLYTTFQSITITGETAQGDKIMEVVNGIYHTDYRTTEGKISDNAIPTAEVTIEATVDSTSAITYDHTRFLYNAIENGEVMLTETGWARGIVVYGYDQDTGVMNMGEDGLPLIYDGSAQETDLDVKVVTDLKDETTVVDIKTETGTVEIYLKDIVEVEISEEGEVDVEALTEDESFRYAAVPSQSGFTAVQRISGEDSYVAIKSAYSQDDVTSFEYDADTDTLTIMSGQDVAIPDFEATMTNKDGKNIAYTYESNEIDGTTVITKTAEFEGSDLLVSLDHPYDVTDGSETVHAQSFSVVTTVSGSVTNSEVYTQELNGAGEASGVNSIIAVASTGVAVEREYVGSDYYIDPEAEGYIACDPSLQANPVRVLTETDNGTTKTLSIVVNTLDEERNITATSEPMEGAYISFLAWDGEVLKRIGFVMGDIPEYNGPTPTKPEDDNYTYAFQGWALPGTTVPLQELPAVTEYASYQSVFTSNPKVFSITWVYHGGSRTDTVAYGAWPSFGGTPASYNGDGYVYVFSQWSPAVVQATEDATYTALYTQQPIYVPGGDDPSPEREVIIVDPEGNKTVIDTKTERNEDGSVTKTVTTETTNVDGTTSSSETVTTTSAGSDGSVVVTEKGKAIDTDGSVTETESTTIQERDGTRTETTAETLKDADGKVLITTETSTVRETDGSRTDTIKITESDGTVTEREIRSTPGELDSTDYSDVTVVTETDGTVTTESYSRETGRDGVVRETDVTSTQTVSGGITTTVTGSSETASNGWSKTIDSTIKTDSQDNIVSLTATAVYVSADGERTDITQQGDGERIEVRVSDTGYEHVSNAVDSVQDVDSELIVIGFQTEDGKVTIPKESVYLIAQTGYEVAADGGRQYVAIDSDVLEMLAQRNGDVELTIVRATSDNTPEIQMETVGDLYAVQVTLTVDGEYVHELSGQAEIQIEPGYAAAYVYYVNEQGGTELVQSQYDEATGKVQFDVPHFSLYMVSAVPVNSGSDNSVLIIVAVIIAILAIACVGYFVVKRRYSA